MGHSLWKVEPCETNNQWGCKCIPKRLVRLCWCLWKYGYFCHSRVHKVAAIVLKIITRFLEFFLIENRSLQRDCMVLFQLCHPVWDAIKAHKVDAILQEINKYSIFSACFLQRGHKFSAKRNLSSVVYLP